LAFSELRDNFAVKQSLIPSKLFFEGKVGCLIALVKRVFLPVLALCHERVDGLTPDLRRASFKQGRPGRQVCIQRL